MSSNLLKSFIRLSVNDRGVRCITTSTYPLLFRATSPCCAEPMKKKKKIDMNAIVQRELKKMRKVEKAIKKQESKQRILKPIEEIEGNRQFLKTLNKRQRAAPVLTFEESEQRALLHKDWSRYKLQQFRHEMNVVANVIKSQQQALKELRLESEDLYRQAVQLDEKLFPFTQVGPVETPPIKNYYPPDGEYIDTTRKFNK